MAALNFCKQYLLLFKFQMAAYITATLLSTAIGVVSPYIIGDFLDALVSGSDINAVFRFCVIFGGLNLLRIAKNYATSIIYVRMHTATSYKLGMDIVKHVQNLSLNYANKNDSAYLSSRISADSNELIKFSLSVVQNVIANTVMIIVPFIVMLHMSPAIALAVLIFDEPTSALDTSTIEKFLKYLQSVKKNKIIIIVSHEKQVIETCDAVVKLGNNPPPCEISSETGLLDKKPRWVIMSL